MFRDYIKKMDHDTFALLLDEARKTKFVLTIGNFEKLLKKYIGLSFKFSLTEKQYLLEALASHYDDKGKLLENDHDNLGSQRVVDH